MCGRPSSGRRECRGASDRESQVDGNEDRSDSRADDERIACVPAHIRARGLPNICLRPRKTTRTRPHMRPVAPVPPTPFGPRSPPEGHTCPDRRCWVGTMQPAGRSPRGLPSRTGVPPVLPGRTPGRCAARTVAPAGSRPGRGARRGAGDGLRCWGGVRACARAGVRHNAGRPHTVPLVWPLKSLERSERGVRP